MVAEALLTVAVLVTFKLSVLVSLTFAEVGLHCGASSGSYLSPWNYNQLYSGELMWSFIMLSRTLSLLARHHSLMLYFV